MAEIMALANVFLCSAAAAATGWWALVWARRGGEMSLAALDAVTSSAWLTVALIYALGISNYLDLTIASTVWLRGLVGILAILTIARRTTRSSNALALAVATRKLEDVTHRVKEDALRANIRDIRNKDTD